MIRAMKGITTSEAADRLGISPARVRRLVLDGRLPAEKFGRDLVINESDVEAFERLKGGRPRKAKAEKTGKQRSFRVSPESRPQKKQSSRGVRKVARSE